MPFHRLIAVAAMSGLALVTTPVAAQQAGPRPPCQIGFAIEGTSAIQAQGEVRARKLLMRTTLPQEGRLQLMLAPGEGSQAEFAQRAIVEIAHLRKDPEPDSGFRTPQIGWQKLSVKLEKTRGTGNAGNPYRMRLASAYEAYGLEPLSPGGDRVAGGAVFLTDRYGAVDTSVAQMDLGRQLSRNSQDLLLTLERTDGEVLARWTIPAADIAAGTAKMDGAYGRLDEALAAKACNPAPALSGY